MICKERLLPIVGAFQFLNEYTAIAAQSNAATIAIVVKIVTIKRLFSLSTKKRISVQLLCSNLCLLLFLLSTRTQAHTATPIWLQKNNGTASNSRNLLSSFRDQKGLRHNPFVRTDTAFKVNGRSCRHHTAPTTFCQVVLAAGPAMKVLTCFPTGCFKSGH